MMGSKEGSLNSLTLMALLGNLLQGGGDGASNAVARAQPGACVDKHFLLARKLGPKP